MATIIDGSTGITTQAIDLANPLPIVEGGTALGSAGAVGNVLVSDGANFTSASKFTQLNAVTLTTQTSVDFTIPSWAKRIVIMFSNVSTSGSSDYLMQLGTSGGIVSTGYASHSVSVTSTNKASASTAGFHIVNKAGATDTFGGTYTISNLSGGTWTSSATTYVEGTNCVASAGNVTISGSVTTLRLTTSIGTDTFDAGTVNVMYE